MTRWLPLALAALTLSACDLLTGCDEETRLVEVELGDELDELRLELTRDAGFTCTRGEEIRSGDGSVIGHRYTCTRCL